MEENRRRNSKKTKKSKKALKVFIIILLIIALIIGAIIFIFFDKLSKMNYVEIDKNDLDVNNNMYDDVAGLISKDEFEDIITVALFGTDSRDTSNMSAGRSDSIIVASINPKTKSIKLISIPRDTYVSISGYGKTKINHAYAYGGEQLSIKTINSNFGLNITEYATVDFMGLVNIINAVGGIEMEITKDEMVVINEYLKEIYSLENKPYKEMTQYGKLTLTGEQALAHARNRYVGSDFTRANRQRDVLTALMNKLSTMDKTKILSLIDVFLEQVKTNINVTDYLGEITSVITNINEYKNNIISVQIPSTEYGSDKMVDGIYYFVSDLEKAKKDFITYLYEK